jgi:quercetin dioxygenase-like cupin family protein
MSDSMVKVGKLEIRYLIDGSQSGSMGIFEITIPPGSNVPPPHSHSGNEEIVYVLGGTLRYTVGAQTRDLVPGESMHTPKGTVHGFMNPGQSVARALMVMSPDIGEQYFRDVAAVIGTGGPPDKAALLGVMARYGLAPGAPR